MRWRRARRGEGGGAAFAGYGKVREAGRRDQRGGEWSGSGEVSSSGLVHMRVKVMVRERMGSGLARQREGKSEWI